VKSESEKWLLAFTASYVNGRGFGYKKPSLGFFSFLIFNFYFLI